MTSNDTEDLGRARPVTTMPISRQAFAPFGELIEAAEDGAPFGPEDAHLDLSQGTPRFYIMNLPRRGLLFRQITRHRRVTQCLASVGGGSWFIAVAPPLARDDVNAEPALDSIVGFLVPGTVAVKLNKGTWHAGPFFEEEGMAFFNLELSDTNEIDHQSSNLEKRFGAPFKFVPQPSA
jgi:ureidoglycolate lyase